MSAKTIMIQGTGSYVGKSVVVTALCRIFKQDGFRVAPFKAQNMALNSFVTLEGGEIGRAQATQAEAAGIEPVVDMNPILLKPASDVGMQVIVRGKPIGNMSGRKYYRSKPRFLNVIKESFSKLSKDYDIIVIEGAGSPAEINLRENDLVNMAMAKLVNAPVILAGDINPGGVFAALIGTLQLLKPDERRRIKGFIINKFRGDFNILKPGLRMLEKKTRKPVLGVMPYFHNIKIPEEDSVLWERYRPSGRIKGQDKITIAVLHLPHISNFTDFDPLENEPAVNLRYIKNGDEIGDVDCIIIPGTKNTIEDLLYIKRSGYAKSIIEKAGQGVCLIGICGGYQMLGREIKDPFNVETKQARIKGLGFLPLSTTMAKEKVTHQVEAIDRFFHTGNIRGYEIHMGETHAMGPIKRIFKIVTRSKHRVSVNDGIVSGNGKIWGTYIHGLFDNDRFRKKFLDSFGKQKKSLPLEDFSRVKEQEYNKLAALVRENVDIKKIYTLIFQQKIRK